MSILSTLGLSSSDADRRAAQARAAQLKATRQEKRVTQQSTAEAESALNKQYALAGTSLAAPIEAAGRYLQGEQGGYDTYRSALGLPGTDPNVAREAYANYVAPINEYGFQDVLRYGGNAGTTASGGTQRALFDYGNTTRFQPWLQALNEFNPLAANEQQAQLKEFLANQQVGQGTAIAGLATGQADKLANLYNLTGAANAGYYDKLAANQGQVGQNILGLAGNILGAGAQFAGMRVPGARTALPQYANLTSASQHFPGWATGVG